MWEHTYRHTAKIRNADCCREVSARDSPPAPKQLAGIKAEPPDAGPVAVKTEAEAALQLPTDPRQLHAPDGMGPEVKMEPGETDDTLSAGTVHNASSGGSRSAGSCTAVGCVMAGGHD